MIQGIQSQAGSRKAIGHTAAVYSVLGGFGEEDVELTGAEKPAKELPFLISTYSSRCLRL